MTALLAKTEETHRSNRAALIGAMLTVLFLFGVPLSTSLFAQVGIGAGFVNPYGVAVEADGSLVVVDIGLDAVVRVDPVTGDRTILSDDSTGTGTGFVTPFGLAIEADGSLVVVDAGLAAVVRVDPVTGDRTIVSGLNIGVNTAVEEDTPLPEAFALVSNYPNPFRSATTLSFTLTRPEVVHLTIYDLLGRHVATLVDGLRTAQQHTMHWEVGGQASGLYLARMQVGSKARTIKMLLVK